MQKRHWNLLGGLVFFLTIGSTIARAGAIYSAEATGSLEITEIRHAGGGVGVDLVGLSDTFSDFFNDGTGLAGGSASADVLAADPDELVVGDSIEQIAESFGIASPTSGFAFTQILTDGVVEISNESTFELIVSFSFSYSLAAEVSVMDTLTEDAFALAFIEVYTDTQEIALDVVESDSQIGGGLFTASDTIIFDVVVAGSSRDTVISYVDSAGFAEATVIPEPGTLTLFGLGLAGFGFCRRRIRR